MIKNPNKILLIALIPLKYQKVTPSFKSNKIWDFSYKKIKYLNINRIDKLKKIPNNKKYF